MAKFETPDFLKHWSTEEVHEKIKKLLPPDIDVSQGSHEWNFTWPAAAVIAEMCEFILPEVIKLITPDGSYGEFLDGHADNRNMPRKSAVAAAGELTITGKEKTVIPAGSLFSTAAKNDEPSVDYMTLTEATIPSSGTITVDIECTKLGIIGNTMANTIVLVSSKLNDITSVTNEKEVSGGTEEERDESLINRIDEYDQSLGESFIGNLADYKRWARSVPGVGEATPVPPSDDSGIVTIILTDENGDPATDSLREAVYNKIMSPANPDARLAPVGATLSVVAPATMTIGIQATIELKTGSTIEAVKASFASLLAVYLPEALEDSEIKYSRIWTILGSTEGVYDLKDLQIGIKTDAGITYGASNIPITDRQLPTIDPGTSENPYPDIIFTTGNV